MDLSATVGSRLKHARWLEFGARRMAPRPWLQLTLDQMKPTITKLVTAAIRKATKAGAR